MLWRCLNAGCGHLFGAPAKHLWDKPAVPWQFCPRCGAAARGVDYLETGRLLQCVAEIELRTRPDGDMADRAVNDKLRTLLRMPATRRI